MVQSSVMSSSRARTPIGPDDVDRFRAVQSLAYRCAEEVAGSLRPGVTERQASAHLGRLLRDNGADDWFHVPFAWFGDRTTLKGMRNPLRFFASSRPLEEGMPYILDVAPIVGGYTADIEPKPCTYTRAGSSPGVSVIGAGILRKALYGRAPCRRLRTTPTSCP